MFTFQFRWAYLAGVIAASPMISPTSRSSLADSIAASLVFLFFYWIIAFAVHMLSLIFAGLRHRRAICYHFSTGASMIFFTAIAARFAGWMVAGGSLESLPTLIAIFTALAIAAFAFHKADAFAAGKLDADA